MSIPPVSGSPGLARRKGSSCSLLHHGSSGHLRQGGRTGDSAGAVQRSDGEDGARGDREIYSPAGEGPAVVGTGDESKLVAAKQSRGERRVLPTSTRIGCWEILAIASRELPLYLRRSRMNISTHQTDQSVQTASSYPQAN